MKAHPEVEGLWRIASPSTARLMLFLAVASPAVGDAQTQTSPQGPLEQEFKAAVADYNAGNSSQAVARLERLRLRAPKSFEVHELLGLAYGAANRNENAVAELGAAADLAPRSASARTNLATAYMRAGHPQQAEIEWKAALALEPQDYGTNRNLAKLYLGQGKITEAIPFLQASQGSRPNALDNGYDLALAYLLTHQLEPARTLIATLPNRETSGELHNLLGRIDEQQGRFVEAANEFSNAAHLEPSEDNLFAWASELLLHRAYEPAIEVFKDATQRFPDSPRSWTGLGMSYYSRGEYEPAVRSLLRAVDGSPRDPRAYLFLSKAYLSSPSQAEEVIDRFRKYASLEPKNALAQFYYAIGLWKGRRVESPEIDYKAVESHLRQSIALDGTNAEVHLQLGILYTEQRDHEKSLPEYQRAIQLDPGLADAHFRLGRYYLRAGRKEEANSELTLFKKLQAQHQAEVDKERAEVQQFVISAKVASTPQP